VIHGDPHLGNYTVFSEGGEPQGINLLDYGCIRIFHPPGTSRGRGGCAPPAARR
jgi:predicted unusual protein kinase regulating ubiquinone biosynthesis (AarF/ABC1/UbiB family)